MGERGGTVRAPMGLSVACYGCFLAGDFSGWAVSVGCICLRRTCGGRDDVWYAGVSFEAEIRDEIERGALPVNPLYYSGF